LPLTHRAVFKILGLPFENISLDKWERMFNIVFVALGYEKQM